MTSGQELFLVMLLDNIMYSTKTAYVSFLTDSAAEFHLMGPASVLQLTVDIGLLLSPETLE